MANKTFATYLSELSAVTSLGAGDKLPALEGGTVKYVDGGDIGGGGAATVVAKTESFTADGASGTVYTNEGAGGEITATLGNSSIGTNYVFVGIPGASNFYLVPDIGININAFDVVGNALLTVVGGDGMAFDVGASFGAISLLKINSANWVCTFFTIAIEIVEP